LTWDLLTEAGEGLLTESGDSLVTEEALSAWPGTAGGAYSPYWGGDIKLYVWAGIFAGSTFLWGDSATDNLDAGNVWGGGLVSPTPPAGRLWVDLTCDVLSVQTDIGGTRSNGAIAQAEAGTATITLADPLRKYDPTNPNGPYQYGGQTRLTPGANIIVFAERWDGTAITQYRLFTGTVDTWSEAWQLHPGNRRAVVVASDAVKDLVALDYGEQPAIGAGDTVGQRIERILAYYAWPGTRTLDTSTNTLQATTLAQSAWELIGRANEDELGFTYLDQSGVLQFRNRAAWSTRPAPVLTVGCAPATASYDTMTTASVEAANLNIKNAVYATRTGGVQQVVRSEDSIARYGLHSYKRTDLGLQNDSQAGAWASFLVSIQGTPRAQLDSLVIRPLFDPTVWPALLALKLVTDRVRVLWTPPDMSATTEVVGRAIGISHNVTRNAWDVNLVLAQADIYANVMHWGPHPKDKLNVGNVYV
jgi:hypothetical protein